jgi:hypothetical protein
MHEDRKPAPVPPSRTIKLCEHIVFAYVLRDSGVTGHLNSGRVEQSAAGGLDVFDVYGSRFEYFSGNRLRSWCVFGSDGKPIDGWSKILEEDRQRMGHFPDRLSTETG